ncbi:MAG: hypothetical protein Q4A34_03230 [Candidatus Saccharibacteria bacterium]|nr:hypothetical protein [Candidatus Saccharibacteria bacterium]
MDNNNQPQQPLPPAPQDPAGPVPAGSPYQMPPKKGLSKGALWGIIGGSIAFVLLIVGVILAVVFLGGPSRDDYRAALNRTQDFAKDFGAYASSMTAATDAKDAKEKVDEVIKKIDTYLDELGKEKAMRDADVKKSYNEMSEEYKKIRATFVAIPKAVSLKDCKYVYVSVYGRSADEVMKEFEEETAKCSAVLKELKDDADADIKNYTSEYSKYLNDYKEYLNKRIAGKVGMASPMPPSSSKLYKILTRIVDDGKKVSEKERALLKLLGDKAGVKTVVL